MTVESSRIRKVTAVCLRSRETTPEVLVFDHPLDEGGFMVQLPAGTVEPNEEPEMAAKRELGEETGVRTTPTALAGVRDEVWGGEARRRWVYVFDAPNGLPDEWPYACDCGAKTRCYWLPFENAQVFEPQKPWLEIAREYFKVRAATGNDLS